MTSVTISLPESLKRFVDDQLSAKGFGNVSEYFGSLVREVQAKEEETRLETLLLQGLASGAGRAVDETFWTELRAEAAQRQEAHRAGKNPA